MEIISLEFVLFVLAVAIIYYLLPGKWQNLFLLAASYYFYVTWDWNYAAILLGLTVFNFFYARWLYSQVSRHQGGHKRAVLWAGIGLNSAALLFFLLGGSFNAALNQWLQSSGRTGIEVAILLPLGFSYRVLECISYLVDIALKIAKPAANFFDFALYLGYFPKLVSGPIERARRFLPHINEKKSLDNQAFARSLMLIVIGLARSTILAGMLTVLVPMSLALVKPQKFSSLELLLGLMGFAFYLYNQFAGYTSIVRGVSGLFGIELTNNFAYPFFSKDFSDFWKRWHISLSSWLRDYIYMPSSRALLRRNPSRTNIPNLILPPLATMLISGLWHGASLNLLVWGALNGVYIVIENLLNLFRRADPSKKTPLWRQITGSLVLISLALFAAIPFQADLPTCWDFLLRLATGWESRLPDLRFLVVIAASLGLDWLQSRRNDEYLFLTWPRGVQAGLATLVVFAVVIVYHLQNAPSTFIYP